MNNATRSLLAALYILCPSTGMAAGVIPLALAQQSDINGRPLAGALLYIYQVGTVATRQDSFLDPGLTTALQWPLRADATGRIPMFYLADGQVHVRLTDAQGVVILDNPSLQVVGPSITGGSSGGGSTVDPSSIMSTGDIKFRMTGETLVGWVKLNGLTLGSSGSGANTATDTAQNLYTYLWANCDQAHCPVAGGMRTTATGDFTSGKSIILPDWRGRGPVGLDDMGALPAGRIDATTNLITGSDGPTTLFAVGGASSHVMVIGDLIQHNHTLTDPGHAHVPTGRTVTVAVGTGAGNIYANVTPETPPIPATHSGTTGIAIAPAGSSTPNAFNTMAPFVLGSWYIRL
jgi:hypothetical protein